MSGRRGKQLKDRKIFKFMKGWCMSEKDIAEFRLKGNKAIDIETFVVFTCIGHQILCIILK